MIFLKFITGIFCLDTPLDWNNVSIVIEERAVLPNQESDVHSHGQVAPKDKADAHRARPYSEIFFHLQGLLQSQ